MAEVVVDVLLQDSTTAHAPIAGVSVFVYDSTGTTLITSGSTASDGHVQFMLPELLMYQFRTYKQGISSPQPTSVDVLSSGNTFSIEASVFTLPQSIDPYLCRLSGYMKDISGRPRPGVDVHFINRSSPLIVGDVGVFGERVATRSDASGYMQIDLWRGGIYRAIVEGHENVGRDILVPDLAAANISHVLFPRVEEVIFTPAGPWVMAAGEILVLAVQVRLTSGYLIDGTASEDVTYSLPTNTLVASLQVLDDTITIRSNVTGAVILTAARIDASLAYVPDTEIIGSGTTCTVV